MGYSNTLREDDKTELFKAAVPQRWRKIVGQSAKDVVNLIRDDQIDILVELAGHGATVLRGTRAVAWLFPLLHTSREAARRESLASRASRDRHVWELQLPGEGEPEVCGTLGARYPRGSWEPLAHQGQRLLLR